MHLPLLFALLLSELQNDGKDFQRPVVELTGQLEKGGMLEEHNRGGATTTAPPIMSCEKK